MPTPPALMTDEEFRLIDSDAQPLLYVNREQRRALLEQPEVRTPQNSFERDALKVLEHAQAVDRLADWYNTQEDLVRARYIERLRGKQGLSEMEKHLLATLMNNKRVQPTVPQHVIDARARAIFAALQDKSTSFTYRRFAGREIAKIDRARRKEKELTALHDTTRKIRSSF